MAHAESKNSRFERIRGLATAAASEFKRLGWPGLLERAHENAGRLAVTSHNRLQAVILTPEAYESLVEKAEQQQEADADALERLRAEFDEHLAVLEGPEGAARLRAASESPGKLYGRVKAGESY